MRYDSDEAAFAGDFIEFSDSWSQAQERALWATILPGEDGKTPPDADARFLACLRPKILALHLTCVDAPPITEQSDLTPARVEEMDMRLLNWFYGTWQVHLTNLKTLGNALRRRLYPISVPVNGTEKETAVA